MASRVSREDFVDLFGEDAMRLPDVLALNTSIADWAKVLDALNDHEWMLGEGIPRLCQPTCSRPSRSSPCRTC